MEKMKLFYKNKKKLPKVITSLIKKEIHLIEKNTKKNLVI